jgi:hypothetical protein
MTTTLANQLPRINLEKGGSMQRPARDSEVWTTAGLLAFNSRKNEKRGRPQTNNFVSTECDSMNLSMKRWSMPTASQNK